MKVDVIVHFNMPTSFHICKFNCTLNADVRRTFINYLHFGNTILLNILVAPVSNSSSDCKSPTTLLAWFELFIGRHRKLQASYFTPSGGPFFDCSNMSGNTVSIARAINCPFPILTIQPH